MIVFGLGTGRSGSQSLSYLLNSQEGALVTHEKTADVMAWFGSEKEVLNTLKEFEQFVSNREKLITITHKRGNKPVLRKLKVLDNCKIVGDVAFYYLPYVDLILTHNPEVRFVCIKRDEEETIRSYLRWSSNRPTTGPLSWFCRRPKRNHWMNHDGTKWKKDRVWDKCYPNYLAKSKEEAIRMYWRDYYKKAEELQSRYSNNFKVFPIQWLNNHQGQIQILTFVGIQLENMNLMNDIRKNVQNY